MSDRSTAELWQDYADGDTDAGVELEARGWPRVTRTEMPAYEALLDSTINEDEGPKWYADDFETTTDLDGEPEPWTLDDEERAANVDLQNGGVRLRVILGKPTKHGKRTTTRTVTYRKSARGKLTATTRTGRVRVWSWAIAPVGGGAVHRGTTIAEYVEKAAELGGIHYFHNLRFDGGFLDSYLQDVKPYGLEMTSGAWRPASVPAGSFGALISDTGAHYARYVHLRDGRRFEVRDSLKKFPATSIADLAKMYEAPSPKGEIDYEAERPAGYWPTADEWEYLETDVEILRTALLAALEAGARGLTIGGDALGEYRSTMAHGKFRTVYPLLDRDVDEFIRRAYRGGWTYINPKWQGQLLTRPGEVYDVNSMYPAVMRESSYPWGDPVWLSPGQIELEGYPHRIVGAMFDATIKPGYLPMIQVKHDARYNPVQYQTEVRAVEWYGTEVDWKLLLEHYDVDVHEWLGGIAFKGQMGLFDRYIDKWMEVKANATGGARTQAKFQLNNLWGRFAINPLRAGRLPGIEDDGTPLYTLTPQEYDEPCYTAVGVWTTSYGRDRVIRAAQSFGDDFLAADTDSVHKLGRGSGNLEVHPTKLGAWKLEAEFDQATYLRAKAYAERIDGKVEAHVAGLPRKLLGGIRVEDLQIGAKFSGKLVPKRVPGGIILESTDFVIGERDAWGHSS